MGEGKVIPSVCRGCHGGCRVLVRVEGRRVTEVKGDPQGPINREGFVSRARWLPFWPIILIVLRHPCGGPQDWKEISWDEALLAWGMLNVIMDNGW